MFIIKYKDAKVFFRENPLLKYIIVGAIILISNIVWYNFYGPPIYGNTGFPINFFKYIRYYYLPFNFYSWPVSYSPLVSSFPGNFLYYLLDMIAFNNYSVSYFLYNVGFEIAGGISLFYLSSKFLYKYGISDIYAMLSVLIYAFSVSSFLSGGTFETGTAELLILISLLYLVLYKSRVYLLLLGFLSFFIFFPFPGGYPDGALILLEEFVIICFILLLREYIMHRHGNKKLFWAMAINILGALGITALSLSYLLFIIYSSGSTLIASSVSLHPVYVFGFIYDWIAVLPNAMRLILNWGDYTIYASPWVAAYLANPVISILLYILPFFALSSILFLKKKDYYIYIILIISIFAATSSNPPFGNIFEFIILYFPPARPFYESIAYYPILVILYAVLFPLTLYNFNMIFKERSKKKNILVVGRRRYLISVPKQKVFTIAVIVLLLIPAYPLYTGMVDESSSVMPVESTIPQYYANANDFLNSHGSSAPVMVFPGVNGFSAYENGDHIWYNGIDLYPDLISNPSISNDLSNSYTLGRGGAYSIISYEYGRPLSTVYQSYQNDNGLKSTMNFVAANNSIIEWHSTYNTDKVTFSNVNRDNNNNTAINWHVDASIYNNSIGSNDLIGYFSKPMNLSKFDYAVMNLTTNAPTSSFSIGFMNATGDFVYWASADDFLPSIQPIESSDVPIYIDNSSLMQNIVAIAIGYNHEAESPLNFTVTLNSLRLFNSPVTYSDILARGLNILGVKYAYADKGVVDPYGSFNGSGYDSIFQNSSVFNRVFSQGTVSIFSYSGYKGLIESYPSIVDYSNSSALLGTLFYNISDNPSPLYGFNTGDFQGSSNSSVTSINEISPTEFIANISYSGSFALFFKEDFSNNWVACNSSGHRIGNHFEADGYGNGWIVSNNTSYIRIIYKGANTYAGLVTISVAIPFVMLACFLLISIKKRKKEVKNNGS